MLIVSVVFSSVALTLAIVGIAIGVFLHLRSEKQAFHSGNATQQAFQAGIQAAAGAFPTLLALNPPMPQMAQRETGDWQPADGEDGKHVYRNPVTGEDETYVETDVGDIIDEKLRATIFGNVD